MATSCLPSQKIIISLPLCLSVLFLSIIIMSKYFICFFLSVVVFVSCKPSYSVIHRGHGVYTDSITIRYNSGNFYPYAD